jgi:hypothetical protein
VPTQSCSLGNKLFSSVGLETLKIQFAVKAYRGKKKINRTSADQTSFCVIAFRGVLDFVPCSFYSSPNGIIHNLKSHFSSKREAANRRRPFQAKTLLSASTAPCCSAAQRNFISIPGQTDFKHIKIYGRVEMFLL